MTISLTWKAKQLPDNPKHLYWELAGHNSTTKTDRSDFGYVMLEKDPKEGDDLGKLAKDALGKQAAEEEARITGALTVYTEPTPPPYI